MSQFQPSTFFHGTSESLQSRCNQGVKELRRRVKQRHDTLNGLNMAQLPASCHLITSAALPNCAHCARIPYNGPKGCYLQIHMHFSFNGVPW